MREREETDDETSPLPPQPLWRGFLYKDNLIRRPFPITEYNI